VPICRVTSRVRIAARSDIRARLLFGADRSVVSSVVQDSRGAGRHAGYGPHLIDDFSRAVDYVDRILKGEKPGDLLVQAPTKCELLVNLKTAKALGASQCRSRCLRAPTR